MKVILFGASGMVGQGVLRECQLDAEDDRRCGRRTALMARRQENPSSRGLTPIGIA
jgi:uncharacterized protein YbjT (DUF2867 family)